MSESWHEMVVSALSDDLAKIARDSGGNYREMAEWLIAEGWRPV